MELPITIRWRRMGFIIRGICIKNFRGSWGRWAIFLEVSRKS
jgi:hypothetical protein